MTISFDLDFPVECDDEYWENPDPELAFKQPPGKPSFMACFISQLKLCEIHAFALRTLYSTRKSKALSGLVGGQWEQRVVAELDSAMNKWIDSVPEHREQPSSDIHLLTFYGPRLCSSVGSSPGEYALLRPVCIPARHVLSCSHPDTSPISAHTISLDVSFIRHLFQCSTCMQSPPRCSREKSACVASAAYTSEFEETCLISVPC